MRIIFLAILGIFFVIVSCADSKSKVVTELKQIAECSEKEERVEPLKRHNRW
jgi:hypothetical protein